MHTPFVPPQLSASNVTVEDVLDDEIVLRVDGSVSPQADIATLHKADVVALARALNVTPHDLTHSDSAESHPKNASALFGVGVMLCMMLCMILYAVRG